MPVTPVTIIANSYGKSDVRLVTVRRGPDRHELRDVTVAIRLEGDFAAAYTHGDNTGVVATDTMKNTVYALAAEHPFEDVEDFGLALTEHLTRTYPQVASARVELTEHLWERIEAGGQEHPHAFRRAGSERRTAVVNRSPDSVSILAGLEDLVVMKTAQSAFEGFPRDRWTTLKETGDRLLATALRATWRYSRPYVPFGRLWSDVRRVLLATFAEHDSRSVQHTLYAMGEAVLESVDVEEIHLAMPNRHHLPVDLTPFGGENRNEIFVATTEPYGLIEATLRRG
ncbi:MAG TPA: urate oxidase [Thermoanaerobaculia bacterium]|jgi:urate oxidase|nr:urate oxidase [Thermoanaerobaculia bacterium]